MTKASHDLDEAHGKGVQRRGRPPQNRAVMRHAEWLGGLEYFRAQFQKHDFPKHFHDDYLIGVIERGVHDVWCRGELWHADVGSLATFAPGEPHLGGAGIETGWSQRILYLPEGLVHHALDDAGMPVSGTLDFTAPFQRDATVLHELNQLWIVLVSEVSTSLQIEEHLLQFLPRLVRQTSKQGRSNGGRAPMPLRDAREYLHAHADEAVHLDTLAQIAGCSKTALIDAFKAHFGLSPHRYLIQLRVDSARQLLRQGIDIAEVALAVGFADQSHLTRHFKAVLGVTPARYLAA
ncbi:AraC family transcriptional regulator [Novosphingobium sp. PhB55]|uniref:AraC family transcriptional regulator n=1 Tax=Novosphingobium sp. PhB55 TaxID=2485106 RepID=UPI001064FD84|nr:AraC family transcriptional regulator [Novosphingobium sp. PhB55]